MDENESIENESDDVITRGELAALAQRARKLTAQALDEFWFRNGFVFEDRGPNKAVPKEGIARMLESQEECETMLQMLFMETHLDDLRKTLADIERERGSRQS
ncbi:MAG: hypothetical protein KGH65_00885 [Candidatus Micrarchaeota archaeon]|nr:hypothetical protein [Candidatus Micrarchaeota archaeon]